MIVFYRLLHNFIDRTLAWNDLPLRGGPVMMTLSPFLYRAALPSGLRSIPRYLAIEAAAGVISKSPTPSPENT